MNAARHFLGRTAALCCCGGASAAFAAPWDWDWDGSAPRGPLAHLKVSNRGPERHVLLVRHGQYELTAANEANDEEQKLTELGRRQAARTGARLALLHTHAQAEGGLGIGKIACSSMKRARETASIIAGELGAPAPAAEAWDPDLAEGVPCVPDPGKRTNPVAEDGPRMRRAFARYLFRGRYPPPALDVVPGLPRDLPGHEYEVVVCHGNVIRYLVCLALQLPTEAWMRLELAHCSVVALTIYPNGAVAMSAFADSGHMPFAEITY
jgi:serine/threonine-protein phosphatase PGAM5